MREYRSTYYERKSETDFLTFARGVVIPSAYGKMLLDDAMLRYEGEGIEPFQRRFFEDVAQSLHDIQAGRKPKVRRFWMERTKKGSKDCDLAICVLWLMAFAKRPIFCQIVAATREQAGIIRKRAEDVLFYNEWLNDLVEIQTHKIVSRSRLGETVIEATDNASAHGGTPDLLILNELVHVSKWPVMETHFNNATGVPRGVMIVSTNAGYKGTKAEVWRQNATKQPERWHMHVWDVVAPWLSPEDVEDAKEMNTKTEFVRLFGREGGGFNWASGQGEALSEDSIDRVFRPGLKPMTKWVDGWEFVAGLDLGVKHDHSALVVLGINRDEKRIRVANMWEWKPSVPNEKGRLEVDLLQVRETCGEVYDRYKLVWFGYDPAEGGRLMNQELRATGVAMHEMAFTGASLNEMAISFMIVMESGRLESYEHSSLRRDLGKFNIEPRLPSGYRLTAISDAHGHADVGTALVICLPKAIILVGGLASAYGGVFMEVGKKGEEEEELTDPFLLDMFGEGDEVVGEEEYADPFADLL